MGNILKRAVIAGMLSAITVATVAGLSLEPLTRVFGTEPAARIHTYRVTNTQDREIAVRIRMTTRTHGADGVESRADASDQWLVFPSRMSLSPGRSQAVRVQYTGPGGIEQEQAFRIIAEQLPVDISEGDRRTAINVLFRYEGSVYVRTGRFAPDVILAAADRQFLDGRFQGIRVRFENRGRTHGILHDLTLRVRRLDEAGTVLEEVIFREEDLPVLGGRNILAGHSLEENLPLPESWSRGVFDVQYDVDLLD